MESLKMKSIDEITFHSNQKIVDLLSQLPLYFRERMHALQRIKNSSCNGNAGLDKLSRSYLIFTERSSVTTVRI